MARRRGRATKGGKADYSAFARIVTNREKIRTVIGRRLLPWAWFGILYATGALAPAQISLPTATHTETSPSPPVDSLGRSTPQSSIYGFLEACHKKNYRQAAHYLDLRSFTAQQRTTEAPALAQQLEDILDRDAQFDVADLSRSPDGESADGMKSDLDRLSTYNVDGKSVDLNLQRVEVKPGIRLWLVSADSVRNLAKVHDVVGENSFEQLLPRPLVDYRPLGTALWIWIALLLLAGLLAALSGLLSRAVLRMVRTVASRWTEQFDSTPLEHLSGPVRLLVSLLIFRAGMETISPSALVRLYLNNLLTLFFFLGVAWLIGSLVDFAASRIRTGLDQRQRALSFSVLPLGVRVIKISVLAGAILSTLSQWGYNTTTILAGLGVGGLAVALAAQKTIENLFGGVSVITDRPVLVGDFCRFGDRVGTVEDIGLRSTRIRTNDRTLVSVPNAQFSAMTLENFSKRDKMWFHHIFGIRCDATPEQVRAVMQSMDQILKTHPKVEVGAVPVRFTGIGSYTYDIETFAYVLTPDFNEFLNVQSDLLLQILDGIAAAGTELAVPVSETIVSRPPMQQLPQALPGQ